MTKHPMPRRLALPAAVSLAVLLSGCSAASLPDTPGSAPTKTSVSATEFTAAHGLAGLTAQQIVEKLDATEEDRTAGPTGSVRPDELVLSDATTTATLTLPPTGSTYRSPPTSTTRTTASTTTCPPARGSWRARPSTCASRTPPERP